MPEQQLSPRAWPGNSLRIKATHGALKTVVHANGSRIKHPEIRKSVRQGIGLHQRNPSVDRPEPICSVDSVPFLTSGYADAKKLYEAQKPFLEKRLAEEGRVLLCSVP